MKIDIKININTVLVFALAFATLIIMVILAFQNTQNYYDYNKFVIKSEGKVIKWYYNCDSFDSKYYNCPRNQSTKNITGNFCNGKILCRNLYEIK